MKKIIVISRPGEYYTLGELLGLRYGERTFGIRYSPEEKDIPMTAIHFGDVSFLPVSSYEEAVKILTASQ